MSLELKLTIDSLEDIQLAWERYRLGGVQGADALIRDLNETLEHLRNHPLIGRRVGRGEMFRSFSFKGYFIFYDLIPPNSLRVLRVVDGRRNLRPILRQTRKARRSTP